jgi:hypothetical protein
MDKSIRKVTLFRVCAKTWCDGECGSSGLAVKLGKGDAGNSVLGAGHRKNELRLIVTHRCITHLHGIPPVDIALRDYSRPIFTVFYAIVGGVVVWLHGVFLC